MGYQALYRKWRPTTFDDVVGQSHVVTTLKNEIISGKTAHAYLFCGTRGTGKTTCAKIFARAINCLNPQNGSPCNECEICRGVADGSIMDIVEIDAASNNGVDSIREIREEVSYSASQAKYKIYIIDEVHMLSSGAFNALLKTLEEPPAHVVFILATTEAHKLPATITSRCQRFDFKRISVKDIVIRLREIVTAENIDADVDALETIARLADGGLRDALSMLDQCVAACEGKIDTNAVNRALGIASDELVDLCVGAIASGDTASALKSVADAVENGKDLTNFIERLIVTFRDILVCHVANEPEKLFEYSKEDIDRLKKQTSLFSPAKIEDIIKILNGAVSDAKYAPSPRIVYELALIKLCDLRLDSSYESLAARVDALEAKLKSGDFAKTVSAPEPEMSEPISEEANKKDKGLPPWDVKPEPAKSAPRNTESKKQETAAKPKQASANSGSANMWPDFEAVIKKSHPHIYGLLAGCPAKLFDGKLYLTDSGFLKSVLSVFEDELRAALARFCGRDVRISYVTGSEFNEIVVPNGAAPKPANEQKSQQADPLDELLNLENEDIIIE